MLGTFQESRIRIEVGATEDTLKASLMYPDRLRQWLPQRLATGLPDELSPGLTFLSWVGPIAIQHQVLKAEPNHLQFLLSQGIDGFHEWYWGDGWVQSRIEGISLLPIKLGQTISLLRLQQFLTLANS